LRNNEKIT